ncbi:hypothetical protein [Streptomyces luteolus]|uniref:Uncharacterized protein n=1 Tax=Streptomyces luteolus TaxID=3043615 RepID=A0ABT6SZ44_9ACTN|nr:hypothetical protein [Streptomyces sp. B-S-A12]MDI3420877.1 hypothetical protein [Streptomyces sp. B-S-A12]
MVPNTVALPALTALVTAVQLQVRIVEEQPYLRSVHIEAYDAYARRAGRFLPGVGRRAAGESGGRGCLDSITDVPVHPTRRPRPALAALVAGVLLACAYLMWGPAYTTMAMAEPMPVMTTPAVIAEVAHAEREQGLHAAAPAPDECPAMSMDCPLTTAHTPLFVAPAAAPGTDTLAVPPVPAEPLSAAAVDDGCAWPRAPDPVVFLCVSRT